MLQLKNLKQVITTFSYEQVCIDFLVQQRWNGSPVCPYCGSNKWYSIENRKRFKCGNKECHKKYSVTVNTCFHASNIPLTTWFPAMYLILSHKKGISSCQLAKDLGVSQKTAWFMLHRIRESLKDKNSPMLKNIVEADELYIGGKISNMSNTKRKEIREISTGSPYYKKIMVVGMLERGGNLKLTVAGDGQIKYAITPILLNNIDKSATLMTDGEAAYGAVGKTYASHQTVNHNVKEFVRDGIIHTNSIEGAFGLFRRTIIGTYHKLSPKHLSRYCTEMQYRYNSRKIKDGNRFEFSLTNVEARLSWKELIKDNGLIADAVIQPDIPELVGIKIPNERIVNRQGKRTKVAQILNGKVIAVFAKVTDAAKATNVSPSAISKALRGVNPTCAGCEWKYI